MASPSETIIAEAGAVAAVTDAAGRVLSVRRLSALDRLRLFKAVGPVLAQNASYFGMAALAVSVIEIDGVPVPAPGTEAQVEQLVARLGDVGIEAAAAAWAGVRAGETYAGN